MAKTKKRGGVIGFTKANVKGLPPRAPRPPEKLESFEDLVARNRAREAAKAAKADSSPATPARTESPAASNPQSRAASPPKIVIPPAKERSAMPAPAAKAPARTEAVNPMWMPGYKADGKNPKGYIGVHRLVKTGTARRSRKHKRKTHRRRR